jgi:hypothetical protein
MKGGGFNFSGLSSLSKGLDKFKTDAQTGLGGITDKLNNAAQSGLGGITDKLNNAAQSGLGGITDKLNNAAQSGLGGITDKLNNAAQSGLEEGTNALNNFTQTVNSAVPTTPIIGTSESNLVVPGTTNPSATNLVVPGTTTTAATNPSAATNPVVPGTTTTAATNPSAATAVTNPVVSGTTTTAAPGTAPVAPGTTVSNPVATAVTAAATIFSFANIIEWIKGNIGKTIFITIFVITAAILIYIFVSPKSKKEGFFESSKKDETKEQNSKQVKIDEVERQLQERINNINTNLTSLKKRMDDADIVKDNKPTNLAIAIQNNILAVKEAMMKIIAGLVVQTKMNNGALSVVSQTNAFQQGINDSLSKFK